MIESVGVGFKEQIKREQKLTGKNSQILSDIKIGDILKGSLTKLENGQTILLREDGAPIPVKLQGMAIFNKQLALEVIQNDGGQVLLKLLQGESNLSELLQNKIIKELDLPETDGMRQLIETFLAKQVPLQREGLLKQYHMSQNFRIPAEVLTNLSEKAGGVSLQEVKDLYEMKQTNLEQALDDISDLIREVKNGELVKDISNVLEKYLGKNIFNNVLKQSGIANMETSFIQDLARPEVVDTKENMGQAEVMVKEEDVLKSTIKEMLSDYQKEGQSRDGIVSKDELLRQFTPNQWEKVGKFIKSSILETLTVNTVRLRETTEESKHIENANKVLKDILRILESAKLPEKCSESLKQLEETVQVLNKFNVQGEYYFFPLTLPQGEGRGELYFFKPKRKTNDESKHLYVVLALDLPQLKNIEIHIRQEKESLLLHFKVKEEGILKFLETHLKDLKHLMGQTKFNIDEMAVSLIETKSLGSILAPEETSLSHMDFKI